MINEVIRKMRTASGFTQKQLSDKVGVALSTISGYELGVNQPTFSTVMKIAAACDFDIIFCDKNSGENIKAENNGQKK